MEYLPVLKGLFVGASEREFPELKLLLTRNLGTFAGLKGQFTSPIRVSQKRSSYLQVNVYSCHSRPFKGVVLAPYSIQHHHQRSRGRLTVENGAGPEARRAPRAPRMRGPREGPLPKAAADWLLGHGARSPWRGWGAVGSGRFHHQLPACKWLLGGQKLKERGRTGTGHSGIGLGIPEAATTEGLPAGGRGGGGGIAGPTPA